MKIQEKGGVDVDTMNKLFHNFRSVGSTLRATETSRNLLEISLLHPATRFALQPDIRTRGETRPYVLQSIVPVASAQRLRSKNALAARTAVAEDEPKHCSDRKGYCGE